jgi:hypothetical protein
MDREHAEIEDVPPLELRKLRDLELEEPSAPERPPHVAAGSGVVRRGDHAYVIGDDELYIAVYRLSDPAPGRLERVLGGELPVDAAERGDAKPDLEALTALPPFEDHPFGTLFGIGSGSGPDRDRGFVWALDADGTLRGEAREFEATPLYDRLREEIGGLNIEGCAVMGDTVWLLHRGNDGKTGNVVAELSLSDVMDSLRRDLRIDAHELTRLCSYELGSLEDVPLTFSDATPLTSELLVFTASAEGEDGAMHGSVVGTLSTSGQVHRLRTIDRRWKVEGVHASIDTGVLDLLFVCDQDDPETPSPLLGATMPLEAAFEPRP